MKRDYYWEVSYHTPYHDELYTVWTLQVEKFVDGFQAQIRFEQLQKEDYRTRPQIKFITKNTPPSEH